MKRKKGSTYICEWISRGNASSITTPQPLGYEVDAGECMYIATMGSITIKADQVANQWAYYTAGEGSSSSRPQVQAVTAHPAATAQETAAGHRRDHRREINPPLHPTDSSSSFSSKAEGACQYGCGRMHRQ